MFVRKKRNRTGTISVVVVDKSNGFKEVKNFGVASTDEEADVLCMRAREWIHTYGGQQVIDFGRNTVQDRELEETERAFANIDSVFMNAPQLILNPIYDSIGFNRIPDGVLRHLVIARICQPMSKLATVDYLKSHFNEDTSLDQIIRCPIILIAGILLLGKLIRNLGTNRHAIGYIETNFWRNSKTINRITIISFGF